MKSPIQYSLSSDKDNWDEFAQRLAHYHGYSWSWKEILEGTFCLKTHYLEAKDGDMVVGILPLAEVKSFLFGHALISLPFINGGGAISALPEATAQLVQEAKELTEKLGADYLELRQRAPLFEPAPFLVQRTHKVSMLLPLSCSTEEQLSIFSSKLRSQIKRPTKDGCLLVHDSNNMLLEMFYSVFSRNMRDLGTPVLPKKLFQQALDSFGEQAKIFVVAQGGVPIASGFTIAHGEHIEVLWASSLAKYNKLSPNMLLYWEMIAYAIERGFKVFDFGRSTPESGTYHFKKQWGAVELPLYWYYFVNKGEVPDVNPSNVKFKFLVECWKRLPLFLANTIGARISKSLP